MGRVISVVLVFFGAVALGIFLIIDSAPTVTMRTWTEDGILYEDEVWIVETDDSDIYYLRVLDSNEGWYKRIRRKPRVELIWDEGKPEKYRASPEPYDTERVSEMMAEEYGLPDQLRRRLHDPNDTLAVQLKRVW